MVVTWLRLQPRSYAKACILDYEIYYLFIYNLNTHTKTTTKRQLNNFRWEMHNFYCSEESANRVVCDPKKVWLLLTL